MVRTCSLSFTCNARTAKLRAFTAVSHFMRPLIVLSGPFAHQQKSRAWADFHSLGIHRLHS